jgi:hypothetical protein
MKIRGINRNNKIGYNSKNRRKINECKRIIKIPSPYDFNAETTNVNMFVLLCYVYFTLSSPSPVLRV